MLTVVEAFAEESEHGDVIKLTEALYDGNHDTTKENCYASNGTTDGNARFRFEFSVVKNVKLLNRKDCCGKISLVG